MFLKNRHKKTPAHCNRAVLRKPGLIVIALQRPTKEAMHCQREIPMNFEKKTNTNLFLALYTLCASLKATVYDYVSAACVHTSPGKQHLHVNNIPRLCARIIGHHSLVAIL